MIKMPWTNSSAPNVMIEVVDGCNVSCKVCYRNLFSNTRSLDEIERDLNDALQFRKLHTITISGGEPTLHPDLCEIVRMIKQRGLHAFLLTNGVLIDRGRLAALKEAGLDSILFHVDLGQKRHDLPAEPSFADVRKRLDELIEAAVSFNLDVSISTILYEDGQERSISSYFLENRSATFLFLSKAVACGTLFEQRVRSKPSDRCPTTTSRVTTFFQDEHDIEPFAYIPTLDGQQSVWVSYFVPVIYGDRGYRTLRYRSTWADSAMMRVVGWISGRHIHKTTQNRAMTSFRILINAVSRLRPLPVLSFWLHSMKRGHELRHKTIVYDDGPYHGAHGVQHCEYCPTAIVREGELVPCCTADLAPGTVSA